MDRILNFLGINEQQLILSIVILIVILLIIREARCWYWRIDDIIKNQEAQLDLMDMIIGEMSVQNRLLLRIVDQIEPKEEPTEQDHKESTP